MYPDNMVQLAVRMYLYRWNDRLQEDATTTAPYEVRFFLIVCLERRTQHNCPGCLPGSKGMDVGLRPPVVAFARPASGNLRQPPGHSFTCSCTSAGMSLLHGPLQVQQIWNFIACMHACRCISWR